MEAELRDANWCAIIWTESDGIKYTPFIPDQNAQRSGRAVDIQIYIQAQASCETTCTGMAVPYPDATMDHTMLLRSSQV